MAIYAFPRRRGARYFWWYYSWKVFRQTNEKIIITQIGGRNNIINTLYLFPPLISIFVTEAIQNYSFKLLSQTFCVRWRKSYSIAKFPRHVLSPRSLQRVPCSLCPLGLLKPGIIIFLKYFLPISNVNRPYIQEKFLEEPFLSLFFGMSPTIGHSFLHQKKVGEFEPPSEYRVHSTVHVASMYKTKF